MMPGRDPATTGSPGTAGEPDGTTRLVRTLTATVFLQWLGATAIVPMLPVYIRHLGGTDGQAGIVMASFFAAGVLFQYPTGRLADRIGRRPVLVGGLLLYGAASLAFLAHVGPWSAVLFRSLQGAGAGAATVAALAMISGSVALERRGRAFAAVYGGELAGMAVGPLIGSIAGVRYLWVMFITSAVLCVAACIPAMRIDDRHSAPAASTRLATGTTGTTGTEPTTGAGGERAAGLRRLHVTRPTAGALLAGGLDGLVIGVYDICWTLLMVSRGATGWQIGLSWTLFALPFVVAARPAGWLADHMDRRALVVAGFGTSALFCAAYPFVPSVTVLIAAGAVEAVGFAAAMPALQSLLTEGADPSEVGRVQGLFATGQTSCTAIAAAGAGAAFAVARWLPFVSVAAVSAVGLVAVAVIWRGVRGRVPPSVTVATEIRGEDAASVPLLWRAPVGSVDGSAPDGATVRPGAAPVDGTGVAAEVP